MHRCQKKISHLITMLVDNCYNQSINQY